MANSAYDPNKDLEEILKKEFTEGLNQDAETVGSKNGEHGERSEMDFNIKPEELESYLNKYVIGQSEAIEVIATKVCTHFNRMKIENKLTEEERIIGNIKSNILLIGPTGVGKTYIVKLIAQKIGVPFIKADATKFSETGYVGGDVEDLVRDLVHEADGDITKAEYGIIYLDEIDKIASSGQLNGPDVSRSGVQRNLLKLMEEAEVDLKTPHDLASQVEAAMEAQRTGKVKRQKINTRNILFIVSGAFSGLDEIIKKRLNMQSIGFEKSVTVTDDMQDLMKKAKTEDLMKYGFESEFIGRLPVYVVLNDLDVDGLYKILKNKFSSVVMGKKLDFRAYDIDLTFTDEALMTLAEKANREKTGARGLLSVFEKTLIKFEKTLPSTEIKKLNVDRQLIDDPDSVIQHLLVADSIKSFQKHFLLVHGIFLEFEQNALDIVQKRALEQRVSIKRLCEDMFHDYHHGIKLMGLDSFKITEEAVRNPSDYLENYIKTNFKKNN